MTTPDDLQGEMHQMPFDDRMVDLLLTGRIGPDDAPADLAEIARLVRAARQPATPSELAQGDHVIAAMTTVLSSSADGGASPRRRRSMIGKFVSAKAAAIAVTTLLGATGAAAATGSLPAQAQTTVAAALGHVGVDVPKPSHDTKADDTTSDTAMPTTTTTDGTKAGITTPTTTGTHGPDATGAARFGLCNAAKANGNDTDSSPHGVAFQNLQAAATAAGKSVTAFCADATPGHSADTNGSTPKATSDDNESTTSTTSGDSAEHQSTTPRASHTDKSDESTTSTTMEHDDSTTTSTSTTSTTDTDADQSTSGSNTTRHHSSSGSSD